MAVGSYPAGIFTAISSLVAAADRSRILSTIVLGPAAGRVGLYPTLDSTATIAIRLDTFAQRAGQNIADIGGKVYNSIGSPVTLVSVEYSLVGPSGPWSSTAILTTDPAYSFPATGSPSGTAYVVPVEFTVPFSQTSIWIRMKLSY